MKRILTDPTLMRRAGYVGGAVVCAALVLPLVPAGADVFGGHAAAASMPGPEVVHLEIVAPGVVPKAGQIAAPAEQVVVYVGCANGRAVGGGYTLPPKAKGAMVVSAPAADGRNWNFQYANPMPAGTKLSVVCWRS